MWSSRSLLSGSCHACTSLLPGQVRRFPANIKTLSPTFQHMDQHSTRVPRVVTTTISPTEPWEPPGAKAIPRRAPGYLRRHPSPRAGRGLRRHCLLLSWRRLDFINLSILAGFLHDRWGWAILHLHDFLGLRRRMLSGGRRLLSTRCTLQTAPPVSTWVLRVVS